MRTELNKSTGLPFVRGGTLRGPMVKSASAFLTALRRYRICSSSGCHGAVVVWLDDAGLYRCHFMRWRVTIAEACFRTKREVKDWLKLWLSRQHETEP